MNKKHANETVITDERLLSVFQNTEEWLSRRQIADRLNRKKTPSLIERIERLADEGHLRRAATDLPNGVTMFWYLCPVEKDSVPL
jgi:hypothetical protein